LELREFRRKLNEFFRTSSSMGASFGDMDAIDRAWGPVGAVSEKITLEGLLPVLFKAWALGLSGAVISTLGRAEFTSVTLPSVSFPET
jgi:hypothetical protein